MFAPNANSYKMNNTWKSMEHVLLVKNSMEYFRKENASKQLSLGKHKQFIIRTAVYWCEKLIRNV